MDADKVDRMWDARLEREWNLYHGEEYYATKAEMAEYEQWQREADEWNEKHNKEWYKFEDSDIPF